MDTCVVLYMDMGMDMDMHMEGDSMDTTPVVEEGSSSSSSTTTTSTTSTPSSTVACATMITRGMEIEMPSGTWSPWYTFRPTVSQ